MKRMNQFLLVQHMNQFLLVQEELINIELVPVSLLIYCFMFTRGDRLLKMF